MPIFQDDLGGSQPSPPTMGPVSSSPPMGHRLTRKLSEESIRTELCEGPLLDSPGYPGASISAAANSPFTLPVHDTSDRELLIERLKKGNSKTWWPNREVRMPFMYFFCEPRLIHLHSSDPFSLTTTNKTLTLLPNTLPICPPCFPRPSFWKRIIRLQWI